jgi:CRISPR/Cas system-associated protein endoribonuclease Cas2
MDSKMLDICTLLLGKSICCHSKLKSSFNLLLSASHIKSVLNGSIRVLRITEEQYKQMKIIENYRKKPEEKVHKQTQTVMVF